ncbi:hydroxyacylglutathione hydrolase [Pseudomonas sp. NCCP-436]|uniref:hydroxyacylglutathione hydrolase n=1 Tax=Pseudomonas sp. NCCP-436 TaxID=2842481 RepID=UPI001C80145F|nr:hydroxyacylglutathione hydrolase [Pseudomonas sp. NCCP-436]GIZ11872.1 hydroxyacylglutathione hydrolase [Pseudomonas sp. NCCP-436]
MIQIDALPAFNDNYIWLLQDPHTKRCAVVDPGDATPVLAWLGQHPGWQLSDILVTHHHLDHVGGIERLKAETGARVAGPATERIPARDIALNDKQPIEVLGLEFHVLAVPGHTLGHIAYYHADEQLLFCGDTLFAAGCGRLFEGTPQQMHGSLARLAALPGDTRVYCTHEYTLSNLRFALAVEPQNLRLQDRFAEVSSWREAGRISLPSNIELELATNPFLRTGEPAVIAAACEHGATDETPEMIFAALRAWKDNF